MRGGQQPSCLDGRRCFGPAFCAIERQPLGPKAQVNGAPAAGRVRDTTAGGSAPEAAEEHGASRDRGVEPFEVAVLACHRLVLKKRSTRTSVEPAQQDANSRGQPRGRRCRDQPAQPKPATST
jgi:hypothetical protein